MHRVYVEHGVAGMRAGEPLVIEGDEAAHALRVKRVEAGERVVVMDGRGGLAEGVAIEPPGAGQESRRGSRGQSLHMFIERVQKVEPVSPRVQVLSATPKGSRVDEMIDQLAQVGVASWSPLATRRGVVDPRETKLARLERIAQETSKQCGRAWTLEIGEQTNFAAALAREGVIIADASGEPYTPNTTPTVHLLIGPEGGFTPEEIEQARSAGARVCRFGPHIMRIETAAVAAASVILAASRQP